MRHILLAAVAALATLGAGCGRTAGDEQALVDHATLSMQDMMTSASDSPRDLMQKARAVMVCPKVFKAGFFFGGEGGSCVLLARAGNGTWSYPAFYGLGSGSFGFQFGIRDAQLILLILTDKGLGAVLDSQVKLGANASLAIATFGGEIQGSTTAAVGADIVAFALSRGLFGGVALEGSVMSTRTEWNQAYYGQPFAARQIVVQMQGVNPGADPLRQVLTRYGGAAAPPRTAAASPRPSAAPPMQTDTAPPPVITAPGGRGPIQEQTLAPPGR